MLEIKIGCTGWRYEPWIGTFYPKNLEDSKLLKYYSSIFDITEINSTYYRIPNQFMTKKWFNDTPDNFRFTAKFPKVITHENKLKDLHTHLDEFLASLGPLKTKIAGLVVQLPPSLSFDEAKPRLDELISVLPSHYKYPIEGRHKTWFTDEAIKFMRNRNLCQVWNELPGVDNPAAITSDFLYLRIIGDRAIPENEFGKVVRNKQDVLKKWARKLEQIESNVKLALVMLNNHFEGFAPASANLLRMELGMSEIFWHEKKQKKLGDF